MKITNKSLQQHAQDMATAAGLTGTRHGWTSMSGLSAARSEAIAASRSSHGSALAAYEAAVTERIEDDQGWSAAEAAGYGRPNQRRGARGAELDGMAMADMLRSEGYTDDEIEAEGGIL